MVGCRNLDVANELPVIDLIERSDGGVSEPALHRGCAPSGILSSVPMVGCRNGDGGIHTIPCDLIERSDGGVSERHASHNLAQLGSYRAFRWWGVGTKILIDLSRRAILSSVPMVGCRNLFPAANSYGVDLIERSDGGVSELHWIDLRALSDLIERSDGGVSELLHGVSVTMEDLIERSDGGVSEHGREECSYSA